jgi:hypothetical protein
MQALLLAAKMAMSRRSCSADGPDGTRAISSTPGNDSAPPSADRNAKATCNHQPAAMQKTPAGFKKAVFETGDQ